MSIAEATKTLPATYHVAWGTEEGFGAHRGRTGWAVMYPNSSRVAMIFGGTLQSRQAAQTWADKLNNR